MDSPMTDLAEKVRDLTTGVRITTFSLSPTRRMLPAQVKQVAEVFKSSPAVVGGDRRVINTKLAIVAPVYSLIAESKSLVGRWSIDYPERGLRLIRIDKIDGLLLQASMLQDELNAAIDDLANGWEEVKANAKADLVDLYCEDDYDRDPRTSYGWHISFPAVAPDARLERLHPDVYAQEKERIRVKMCEALEAAESGAANAFVELLNGLAERLEKGEDGKLKTLRSSTIQNIRDAVTYWGNVSLGNNDELSAMVTKISGLVNDGVDVKKLKRQGYRDMIATRVQSLSEEMSKLVVVRGRRQLQLDEE